MIVIIVILLLLLLLLLLIIIIIIIIAPAGAGRRLSTLTLRPCASRNSTGHEAPGHGASANQLSSCTPGSACTKAKTSTPAQPSHSTVSVRVSSSGRLHTADMQQT